ncbi:PucR family transcriptional regulator [Gordonia terrae]|nr:helix-turn-helix domain-containing protein [Gordonia terrae]ANY22156.1 hypothetical protein BCM27_04425 [Gordonia terrae]
MIAVIFQHVPEAEDPEVASIVRVTCEGNLYALVGHMARGVPLELVAPTSELRSQTTLLASMGLPLPSILRAYHVGAGELVRQFIIEVDKQDWPRGRSVEVIQEGTTFMLRWGATLTEGVTAIYAAEASRITEHRDLALNEKVRAVLQEPDVDVRSASRELGYALNGSHVALVQLFDASPGSGVPGPPSDFTSVFEQAVQHLRLPSATAGALHVRVDLRTVWSWVPADSDVLSRLDETDGPILVGIGTARTGIDGFRASHDEARQAARVAQLRSRPTGRVTRFRDVDMISLCTQDVGRARDFVRNELGPLARQTPAMDLLRSTLMGYLQSNSNSRASAARLYVHHNTVRSRIERIESLLGHTVTERRAALELALAIDETLGLSAAPMPE